METKTKNIVHGKDVLPNYFKLKAQLLSAAERLNASGWSAKLILDDSPGVN